MPHVPRRSKVGSLARGGRHAMAGAAEIVQLRRGEFAGIARMDVRGIARVRGAGTVAILAPHAQFHRHDRVIGRQVDGAGGMAREAAHDAGGGIEDAEADIQAVAMPGRRCVGVDRAVPALCHLDVGLVVEAPDESDRLRAGAERPLARLRRPAAREGGGVGAPGLCGVLGWVASTAGVGTCIVGNDRGCEQNGNGEQSILTRAFASRRCARTGPCPAMRLSPARFRTGEDAHYCAGLALSKRD